MWKTIGKRKKMTKIKFSAFVVAVIQKNIVEMLVL